MKQSPIPWSFCWNDLVYCLLPLFRRVDVVTWVECHQQSYSSVFLRLFMSTFRSNFFLFSCHSTRVRLARFLALLEGQFARLDYTNIGGTPWLDLLRVFSLRSHLGLHVESELTLHGCAWEYFKIDFLCAIWQLKKHNERDKCNKNILQKNCNYARIVFFDATFLEFSNREVSQSNYSSEFSWSMIESDYICVSDPFF